MNRLLRVRFFASILLLVPVVFLAGCGSASTPGRSSMSSGSTPVSLTMGDTPPAGVTVLSFEVTVTGALLEPGDVSLLSKPTQVEVSHLDTEKAFLNTASAPAGQYTGIKVTFSNPEMTISNNSGAAIGSCANGSVCELTPPLNPASVIYSGPPFPLNLTANTPVGLLLDFNLDSSIQNDLSINPTITFSQLPMTQHEGENEGEDEEMDHVFGQITGTGNNQFTLQTRDGRTLTISVDANTKFEDFQELGLANSFVGLAVGENVEVELSLASDGTLLALQVELAGNQDQEDLKGTIVAIDSPTEFKMVVVDEFPDIAGVNVGNQVTVTIQSGAAFRIRADDLSLPADVSFQTSSDLLVGQNVEVQRLPDSSGTSITTDRITLRMSHLTAQVESTSPPNFLVNHLPSLFAGANPPITDIQVLTSPQTEFEDVAGVSALSAGDMVSLRGLLFKTAGTPELIAEKVRKR